MLNHHQYDAGRTYNPKGYTANTLEMNGQVNLREETSSFASLLRSVSSYWAAAGEPV